MTYSQVYAQQIKYAITMPRKNHGKKIVNKNKELKK
jgi:hypothetical protein